MPCVVVKNLTKSFGKLLVLSDMNLEVEEEQFVCVVGPSGCGKSTFLRTLMGLEKADKGEVFVYDKLITEPDETMGFVFQEYTLFPWKTLIKNIEFPLEMRGVNDKERKKIAEQFIRLVGLQGFEDCYPYELSGGMKQRAALARALTIDPKVLLMDEPFASVDTITRSLLQEELVRIWQTTRKAIIFVTHAIDEAVYLGQKIVVLSCGPARIKTIHNNTLPYPRDRNSPELAALRGQITAEMGRIMAASGERIE